MKRFGLMVIGLCTVMSCNGTGAKITQPNSSGKPWLVGVSLAGADFGVGIECEGNAIGTLGKEYTYPTRSEVDYYIAKKMTAFRIPFRWERLEPQLGGTFDATNLNALKDIVGYISSKGATSVLDPHNYARYCVNGKAQIIGGQGSSVTTAQFAQFWSKLSAVFKDDSKVVFGLMNEPEGMSTELWRDDAQAAISAIRAVGAKNLILAPGNAWTGAWSWQSDFYGSSNAKTMLTLKDPANNLAFEVHQYFDQSHSGTEGVCNASDTAPKLLEGFTNWLKTNNLRGYLGEFAGWQNPTCDKFLNDALTYIQTNRDVWIGWAYWAGGPWWGNETNTSIIEPVNGVDKPQMKILEQYLK
jgi:endoglucanase